MHYNQYNLGICWPKQHCCIYRWENSENIKMAACSGSVPCWLTTPPSGWVYEGEMYCVNSCGKCRVKHSPYYPYYDNNVQSNPSYENNIQQNYTKNSKFNEYDSSRSVSVRSILLSNEYCMKIISVKNGTTAEKYINPNLSQYNVIKGDTKYIVIIHSLNEPFNFSSVFNPSFRGLGSGRCSCWKWSGPRCKRTRYDDDCCDMDAYFNRCDNHCDLTCSEYNATWTETPDEC